jgi:hypothetical protein
MYVLVIIPTTAGPLIVRRLTARQALPASCAFAEGDYRPLPWSNDYARLVGPDGPLARRIPELGKTAYELRISGSFDAGRSWEAPTALAHITVADGDTLTDDPALAERILWATGAVDLDLNVIPADYALIDKLNRSKTLFESAPQAALDIRLPPGREGEAACAHACSMLGPRAASVRIVSGLMDLQPEEEQLRAPAASPGQLEARPRVLAKSALAISAIAGATLVAAIASGAWFYSKTGTVIDAEVEKPKERVEPPARQPSVPPAQPAQPPPMALSIEEMRAPPGGSCRRLLFGADQPVFVTVAQVGGKYSPSRVDRALCGLRYRITEAGRGRFTLPPELTGTTILSPSADPAGTQTVFLRENLNQNVVYTVQVVREGDGGRQTRAVQHELRIAGP